MGLGILLYPTASDLYARWQVSGKSGGYNEVTERRKENYTSLWNAAEKYNWSLLEKDPQF